MSIELIVAPPAGGKTQACIQRIQAVREFQPLAAIWVVVPDRLQAGAFRQRIADQGGALGTYVGTFGDLYRHILERSQVYVPVASSPLLHRLVQEAVDRAAEQGELNHYAPLQSMPGFILALRESFAECKRSLIYPEQLVDFARPGSAAQQELAGLYSRYQARLRALNWADPEGISWLAVEALERQPAAAASIQLLVVDGFDSFNGAQQRALKLLARQVRDVLITFPGLPGSQRPAHRRFVEGLENLRRELAPRITTLDCSVCLPAELAHIERCLFEPEGAAPQPAGNLRLLEARSPADEAREALRWIKGRVIRDQVSLSDCMIFTPDPALYHPHLRVCAAEFGIPIRFTLDEPLAESAAISALLNLLTLPSKNFNTRSLINLLRSPYFDLSIRPETVDQLERISRVAQIVEGRDQWQETWERLAPAGLLEPLDLGEEQELPGLPRGPEALGLRRIVDTLFQQLAPPRLRCALTDWIAWLEDLLDQLHFYERAGSERDQAACEVFRETLRALVLSEAVAGERPLEYEQFLTDLQGTLAGIGLREPSTPGQPSLMVGRMLEARGLRLRAVALLGFSEGIFPANEHPDPFLDEGLRSALSLDQRLQREQAGLFYQAVTRSDQYLLITRPYLSEDGERWEESTFWKAVQRLFEAAAVERVRPDDPRPLAEAASTQELLFSAVRRHSLPLQYAFLNERWNGLRQAREVLKVRRAKTPQGPYEGRVESIAPSLRERYSPAQVWSASRLEQYGSCPFQFFIQSALGLEARTLPQLGLDPGQLGSILHKILEETYRGAPDPADTQGVLACLEAAAQRVFATAPRAYGFRPSALWENEKAQLLDRLSQSVREMAKDTEWQPCAYELNFGIGGTAPLEIDLDGEALRIRGVIDRLDRNTRGELRVVDYKTGGSHLTLNDFKDGRRLQLPIYALAARDALHLGAPVEGLYWKILAAEAGPLKLSKVKDDSAQGFEAALSVLRWHLARIVRGIRAAEFPPRTPRGGCPAYCPTAQWCWHFEAERGL